MNVKRKMKTKFIYHLLITLLVYLPVQHAFAASPLTQAQYDYNQDVYDDFTYAAEIVDYTKTVYINQENLENTKWSQLQTDVANGQSLMSQLRTKIGQDLDANHTPDGFSGWEDYSFANELAWSNFETAFSNYASNMQSLNNALASHILARQAFASGAYNAFLVLGAEFAACAAIMPGGLVVFLIVGSLTTGYSINNINTLGAAMVTAYVLSFDEIDALEDNLENAKLMASELKDKSDTWWTQDCYNLYYEFTGQIDAALSTLDVLQNAALNGKVASEAIFDDLQYWHDIEMYGQP